jgi:hypothetical protein
MANVMKKITIGNPLAFFGLWSELDEYNSLKTDRELVAFFHRMLTKFSDRPLVCNFLYVMLSFSADHNVQSLPESL